MLDLVSHSINVYIHTYSIYVDPLFKVLYSYYDICTLHNMTRKVNFNI